MSLSHFVPEMRWTLALSLLHQGQADLQLRQHLPPHTHPTPPGTPISDPPTHLLTPAQDRIDELQNKIVSIESRSRSRQAPSVPSQSPRMFTPPTQQAYTTGEGSYVQFSPTEYAAGPSRSLFTAAGASHTRYVADYVASDCSSTDSSNNLGFTGANYGPATSRNSPATGSWDAPFFETASPQLNDLGRDGSISECLADKM